MKRVPHGLVQGIFLSLAASVVPGAQAQIPDKCFEIEAILVDACIDNNACPGSQEGRNEMVRFRTGPDPIALTDIDIQWPNNAFQSLVQNATTASLTAQLNATIEACGFLLEPAGGVIPPGSGVILITSTDICLPANPFNLLPDTLYIIFQAPGNTSGHFANHNNGPDVVPEPVGAQEFRTLIMTYIPTACGDTATYDRSQLVNILGSYGGPSSINDGSTALFSWPGVPEVSYVNYGCQAPYVPLQPAVEVEGDLCNGNEVMLSGSSPGEVVFVQWSGGTGTFSTPNDFTTNYTAGPGDQGLVEITLCVQGPCDDPFCTTVFVPVGSAPVVAIAPEGPLQLCPGESIELTASGAETYLWSDGTDGALLVVDAAGTYTVTGSNACGSDEVSILVEDAPALEVSIAGGNVLCPGQALELTATGGDGYAWSTGEGTATININEPGTYSVTVTGECGIGNAEVEVVAGEAPQPAIAGQLFFCPGDSSVLTATGGDAYVWNTGEEGDAIVVTEAGTYTVTASNACGSAEATVQVIVPDLNASFDPSITEGGAPLPVGFVNTGSTEGTQIGWDFGDGTGSGDVSPIHTFEVPGSYLVVLTITGQGCTVQAEALIDVGEPFSTIVVPNVFTPNGDGVNDLFSVDSEGLRTLDMAIMNRWGQEVFRMERPGQSWDARTFAGETAPEGTYFYVLKATGHDGRVHEVNGTFTLLR